MNIYVYSDESGVFDKVHNDFFTFGGLIMLSAEMKSEWEHKYSGSERVMRGKLNWANNRELKASSLTNSDKGKLFRALGDCYKFGVIIEQKRLMDRIFTSKKDKQRYLDYAFKIAAKRAFQNLIGEGLIIPSEINHLCFFVDEHTTATNGRYELRESLEQEFKNGTYNMTYDRFHHPIFTNLKSVDLNFCNSATKLLIRASDIVANRIYFLAHEHVGYVNSDVTFHVIRLPDRLAPTT